MEINATAGQLELTDTEFELADAIEAAFASKPADCFWTYGELAGKTGTRDRDMLGKVLRYMLANQYAVSNGRGGCWERFATASYRPHN